MNKTSDPKTYARLRKKIGLTQSELASALGVSRTIVSMMETGASAPSHVARSLYCAIEALAFMDSHAELERFAERLRNSWVLGEAESIRANQTLGQCEWFTPSAAAASITARECVRVIQKATRGKKR